VLRGEQHRARRVTRLDELVEPLLTRELLEREDIERIMQGVPNAAPRSALAVIATARG
jgi:hypothetical protein